MISPEGDARKGDLELNKMWMILDLLTIIIGYSHLFQFQNQ